MCLLAVFLLLQLNLAELARVGDAHVFAPLVCGLSGLDELAALNLPPPLLAPLLQLRFALLAQRHERCQLALELGQPLQCLDALSAHDLRAVERLELWQRRDDVVSEPALPVRLARVACEEELRQDGIVLQRADSVQLVEVDKVDCQVELAQRLAALEVLDLGDVVEREVQVVELLQPVQALDFPDEVGLQVDNLEAAAVVEALDLVDVQLVKRNLLERREHAFIVLRLPANQRLGQRHSVARQVRQRLSGVAVILEHVRHVAGAIGGGELVVFLLLLELFDERLVVVQFLEVKVCDILDGGAVVFFARHCLPLAIDALVSFREHCARALRV